MERSKLYSLSEILLVTLCGVSAGCDGWADIELFAKERVEVLRQYLPFEHGTPSDDTLRRLFQVIDPRQFQTLFTQWVEANATRAPSAPTHIAIDGKTSRGSADGQYILGLKSNQGALHQDVLDWFEHPPKSARIDSFTDHDKGHDRIETRWIRVTDHVDWVHQRHANWSSIRALIELTSTRQIGEQHTTQRRYYIASAPRSGEPLLATLRVH